jgi:RimJ/RimL family protein N-acetyltransferase
MDSPMDGVAELAYALLPSEWGHGYGGEAARAVVFDYASELARRGYSELGHSFNSIYATARTDNPGSYRILRSLGFEERGVIVKMGHERYEYWMSVEEAMRE